MADIVSDLVTAGASLAQKVLFSLFERRRTKITLAKLEQLVAEQARREAQRLELNEEDLTRVTGRIAKRLVDDSPAFELKRGLFAGAVVKLRVDAKEPDAGPRLVDELQHRVEPVASQELDIERKAGSATAPAESPEVPPEDADPTEPPRS